MPLISGQITQAGVIIDVFVGVSAARRRVLERCGFAVPRSVAVRAQIDTGAYVSGFAPRVFADLGISPVGNVPILTPSTAPDEPHYCDQFDVTLSLVAGGTEHPFVTGRVIAAPGFHLSDGIEGLIGRDILARCSFQYWGPDARFEFAF